MTPKETQDAIKEPRVAPQPDDHEKRHKAIRDLAQAEMAEGIYDPRRAGPPMTPDAHSANFSWEDLPNDHTFKPLLKITQTYGNEKTETMYLTSRDAERLREFLVQSRIRA